jgi:hypothetical protein
MDVVNIEHRIISIGHDISLSNIIDPVGINRSMYCLETKTCTNN